MHFYDLHILIKTTSINLIFLYISALSNKFQYSIREFRTYDKIADITAINPNIPILRNTTMNMVDKNIINTRKIPDNFECTILFILIPHQLSV